MKFKTEQTKLKMEEMEQYIFQLIKEGKLSGDQSKKSVGPNKPCRFDIGTSLKLMPKFSEKNPNMFFSLFKQTGIITT